MRTSRRVWNNDRREGATNKRELHFVEENTEFTLHVLICGSLSVKSMSDTISFDDLIDLVP